MPKVFVLDSYALMAIPTNCKDLKAINSVMNLMTDRVRAGLLTFPDIVASECASRAPAEMAHVWSKAVAGSRTQKRVPAEWQEAAQGLCDTILDVDDEHEQSPILVAAMALLLDQQPDLTVVVVTEDRLPVPERTCLAEACRMMSLSTCTVREFIAKIGGRDLLNLA